VINRGGVCCVPGFKNTEKEESVTEILIMYLACVLANNKERLIGENKKTTINCYFLYNK
jgi:hypothetical protein